MVLSTSLTGSGFLSEAIVLASVLSWQEYKRIEKMLAAEQLPDDRLQLEAAADERLRQARYNVIVRFRVYKRAV